MDPYSSVCFDIPGGRKNRRREAADLGPDALMLCSESSDAAPADKDARRAMDLVIPPHIGGTSLHGTVKCCCLVAQP